MVGGRQADDAPVHPTFEMIDDTSSPIDTEYDAIRADMAKSETPNALIIVAILVVALSTINFAIRPASYPEFHVIDFATALVLLSVGVALRTITIPPAGARWSFAGCMVMLVVALLVQVRMDPSTNPAYVLIVICLVGPLTLSWGPFTTASITMVALAAAVIATLPNRDTVDWTFLAVTSALGGGVLLHLRLQSIHALAATAVRVNEMATTDPLTGALNRRGLEEVLPTLAATATRLRLPVTVFFVDVDGLKSANDAHGHAFGDKVLQAVADAIQSTARAGDLVARWGGDEFLIIGMGGETDSSGFAARLGRSIRWSDGDFLNWCRSVSVGHSSGRLDVLTAEELVAAADADMYEQRTRRRATGSPD